MSGKELLLKNSIFFKNTIDKPFSLCYNITRCEQDPFATLWYLGVAQVVERYLGVVEAVGSSPATQTNQKVSVNYRDFFYVFRKEFKIDEQIYR